MNRKELDAMMERICVRSGGSKRVHGVGINNSRHIVSIKDNGREYKHRAYEAWVGILRRCYSGNLHLKRPTYSSCEISEEWYLFSSFHSWWKENNVDGWHIDKDLMNPCSNVYSKENCIYIPASLNSFTTAHDGRRGLYPIGCSYHPSTGKFRAIIADGKGKSISLGLYFSPIDAHKAWYQKKIELAHSYKGLCDSINPNLFTGLLRKIESMKEF